MSPSATCCLTVSPQTNHNADVPNRISEDCLNLNVYTPAAATNASSLPVGIFFHGGGFNEGSDQGPFGMYDGSYLAGTNNLIVVTANYRLGAFGFLAVGRCALMHVILSIGSCAASYCA